jgi:hypothetical protein
LTGSSTLLGKPNRPALLAHTAQRNALQRLGLRMVSDYQLLELDIGRSKVHQTNRAWAGLFSATAGGKTFYSGRTTIHTLESPPTSRLPQNVKTNGDIVKMSSVNGVERRVEPICIEKNELSTSIQSCSYHHGRLGVKSPLTKVLTEETDTMSNALSIAFFEFGRRQVRASSKLSITSWMFASHRNGVKASKELQESARKILISHRSRRRKSGHGYLFDLQ